MTNNKKGVLALLMPLIVMVVVIILYTINRAFISHFEVISPAAMESSTGLASASPAVTYGRIISAILSLVGTLNILCIPVYLGLAIYFFTRKEISLAQPPQQ